MKHYICDRERLVGVVIATLSMVVIWVLAAAPTTWAGPGQSPNRQTGPNRSRTTVISSQNPSVFGEEVTFTATVTSAQPGTDITPTGIVTFTVDSATPVTRTLSAGVATYPMPMLAVGPHSIKVDYGGDPVFDGSTCTLTQTVNEADTTTTLTAFPNPSVVGQIVTFNATVSAVPPGSGTPTGSVQFKVDGINMGNAVVLSNGSAPLIWSSLSVGTHTITAEYSGDAIFTSSTGTLSGGQTVNKANTFTGITSNTPNPSVAGQSVTVNFNVLATAPGSGTPTGNVTVSDGVDSCTGTVAAGTCNVILTTVGTRTLTATYAGDSNFNGSSGTASHTVNQAKAYLPYVARNYPPPTPTPTPTPTLTPTPTHTPTPTLALATVRVNNQTGANLTYQVFYPGSQPKVFPPGQ